jgi:carbamoyl-phosphate synthase small subunit
MVDLNSLLNERQAVLVLNNGQIFRGTGFGATKRVYGELVFTTFTAAGYYEALTDPSNWGQIYVLTYPLIGNYGVPPWEKDENGVYKWFESSSIKCTAFVVHECCKQPSHYESVKTLNQFLAEENIPGIEGIDTRRLTQILRTEGSQVGMLEVYPEGVKPPSDEELLKLVKLAEDPNLRHLVKEVSRQEPEIFTPKDCRGTVVLVDCGIKNNTIRNLLRRGMKVVVLPYNATYEQVMSYKPNGVLISNGPGDPKQCVETIELTKRLIAESFPTMGICLGNQILGLAAGGDTYKMKYGHRGGNKPVLDLRTNRAYITSQNHGYAVNPATLGPSGFKPLFINCDDENNEGIYHETKPIFSVQFHPEAYPGPNDTEFLFDDFMKNMGFKPISSVQGGQH